MAVSDSRSRDKAEVHGAKSIVTENARAPPPAKPHFYLHPVAAYPTATKYSDARITWRGSQS
jgi:hypothetical protein